MLNKPLLASLKSIPLREVWKSEADSFTPWLASPENITLLGDAIGIDLEVEAQEKNVGPFRADILCKDTVNDHWVLVENQLERTDHTHLGQLITYAAGLNTVTIVWIADRFREEHRAALDWLNEFTSEDIGFFGLEVELWQISDSPIAPKFNVVSSPNNWTKGIAKGAKAASDGALSPTQDLQLRFWTAFVNSQSVDESKLKTTKPHPQNWMSMAIGRSGFRLHAIASTGFDDQDELRAELELHDVKAKHHFAELESSKCDIEEDFGSTLIWHNLPDKKTCKIYVRRDSVLSDETRWDEYFSWLCQELDKFKCTFEKRIKSLSGDIEL